MKRSNSSWTALVIAGALAVAGVARAADTIAPAPGTNAPAAHGRTNAMDKKLPADEAGWKQRLTPEQYRILRQKGTERAFTGAYWNHHESGSYVCAGCGLELFTSTNKYDSGCGWPSYTKPLAKDRVAETQDHTLGMSRVEVTCSRCGGHLGHVFEDGPAPTGLRYCINSGAITFQKQQAAPTTPPKKETP